MERNKRIYKLNMKSLLNYFLESKEDGKYLDLPKKMYKPVFGPYQPKDYKAKAKQDWKEYQASVIKINTENFEILIDKLKKAIQSKQGHNNFILNAENCKFTNFYGKDENGNKDFFSQVEWAAKTARVALESDDLKINFLRTRQKEKTNSWDKDEMLYWTTPEGFTLSIYDALSIIAQAYNIDIPEFNEDLNLLAMASVQSRLDNWTQYTPHSRPISDEKWSKQRQKFEDEYAKDAKKLKKAREAFAKSDLCKDILNILDIVEDDLKAADEKYKKYEVEYKEKLQKDKEAKELADAIEDVKDKVNAALEKEFYRLGSISWGIDKLYNLAGQAYLESDKKDPTIKVVSSNVGSWLSGMHKTVEFEIIGANDKSYGIVKLQDKGLDDDNGRPVPGFGPWD